MTDNLEKDYDFNDSRKETVLEKCDNCGGNMIFDPATQCLKCEHCGSLRDFSKNADVKEIEIENALMEAEKWDREASAYRCENCGAVVILASGETATKCPYCNTAHIVKSSEFAGLKPNCVYPFTITRDKAVEKAKEWAKKRIFAPKKFKKSLKAENVTGIYEPCFTFDSTTYSSYSGRIGKNRTRTVGSGKNRRTETYTEWRNISGTFTEAFDDVMVSAGNSYGQNTLEKLMPFDYGTIKVYEQKYLTGFMAHRHEKDVPTAWENAKSIIDKKLKSDILDQYDYDVIGYINVSTTHENVTYKYVLLPVYTLNFKYKNKIYAIFVNGNTGKVTGKTPVSPLRVGILVLIILAVIAGAAYLYFKYQGV